MTVVFGFVPYPLLAAICAAALLMAPARAVAQSAPGSRVLVMPFSASARAETGGGAGATLWIGEAASVLLGESLASAGMTVVTRDERVGAFERLHLPMSSALTRATMIRVGELIGASEIVFGEVSLGETLSVQARSIRLEAGQELQAVTDRAALADIFTLFARMGGSLASRFGVAAGRAPTVVPLPLEAFESYVKGLVAVTPPAQQRFLEEASRLAPADARILMALWRNYSTQGLHDKALATANAVPIESPLVQRARLAVAFSLIELRRLDGAYQELSTLHAATRAPAVSNALGVVQLRRGIHSGASQPASYFSRAVAGDPTNIDYLFNLGYAYALAGNAAEALVWLREAVRVDAANGDAHLVMSAVLTASGRHAEAQREFDLARLLGAVTPAGARGATSSVPPGLERLATDLDSNVAPRLDAAIVSPAQRDQHETAAFHLARARELIAQRQDRQATDELRRAIYLAPYEDEPHLLLGRIYARAGRLAAAIDELTVALWCRETTAARLALGAALLESGERDAARREAERALVLSPNSTEARDLLRRIGGT